MPERDRHRPESTNLRSPAFLGATAALAALVVGCGGGSSALTHAQLVSKANAICSAKNTQVAALGRATTVPQLQRVLSRGISIAEQADAKLRALKPPASDAAAFQATLALDAQTLALDRQALQAASSGNLAKFRQLIVQATSLSSQARTKAAQLGLSTCGQTG
ncbi:MAG TPA: hypothetical protein VGY97_03550 [Solirubrobacteraceae bacterium]|nr:hypothetical protein [Solirubrobacteraceae bacterium]